MMPLENERGGFPDPAEAGPDSEKSPTKLPDPPVETQPEIPKVGTADAPGG